MKGERMIRMSGVTKGFGAVEAVRDMNVELSGGKILALLGPSGCGKTTTLRMLAGFERPDAGEIEIAGRTVARGGAGGKFVPPEKRRVGMVFQDYALFPHLSVTKNVAYGLKGLLRGKSRDARVEEVLGLARLTGLEDRMPHELSGGQQQRVALARALAPGPEVVLLDEPFSNLDAALRAEVRSEMRGILKTAGATAVFVTHDQAEALSVADEVAVVLRGGVVQTAPPYEIYHRSATPEVARFVGEANFLPGTAEGNRALCELGEVAVEGDAGGTREVEVMLRPEALALRADPNGPATVVGREFYGHDQLVKLRLGSGRTVLSRLSPGPPFGMTVEPGERAAIEVLAPALVFPNASGGGRL